MVALDVIREQIAQFLRELAKAPDAHYNAEMKAEQAQLDFQAAFDKAFLTAEGTIEDRKALARSATQEQAWALSVCQAEFNRIKLKTKQLEQSIMANQSLLKSLQMEGL